MTVAPAARWLSVREVAAMLGVSTKRIRELVAEGRLSSVRLGENGWHRFRVEDVERLIAGQEPGS
jgi:excisionase family DNA binding protein